MTEESDNRIFETAWEIVNHTGLNVFLTGKAGTGKTTFLKKLVSETAKKCVVVAPTGVAAINAGGATMHSFFQLPFNIYLKNAGYSQGEVQFTNKSELLRNMKFFKDKRNLINELDLLIIDEVSMLRADMLDAMDEILRSIRGKRNKAFGGLQVLFIGDMFQLPPIVTDREAALFNQHYESPFFFSAEVLKENPPLIVELKKIYRQTEEKFIGLLNNIRHNSMATDDYDLLHSRYNPMFNSADENIITLTTHNSVADKINQDELRKLTSPVFKFSAEISGDFNSKNVLTEEVLILKEGAQVMFIKNDTKGGGRYYNGKLATITKLSQEEIIVKLAESNDEIKVDKEKWENIKYVFNKEDNLINQEPLGSFSQYPIRLAWAITIHKSQGLTFSKLAIDAGSSFAAGQVYVALSRCTSLNGLTLLTKITDKSIRTDSRIVEFTSKETDIAALNLEHEMFVYSLNRLEKVFDWRIIIELIDEARNYTNDRSFDGKEDVLERMKTISEKAKEQGDIAVKLVERINQIVSYKPIDTVLLSERVMKGKTYFIEKLHQEIVQPIEIIRNELKKKKKTKQLISYFRGLETDLLRKIGEIEKANVAGLNLMLKVSYKEHFKVEEKTKEVKENSKIPGESKGEEYVKEKAYSVDEIRKHKPNAFRPWTKEDDEKLFELSSKNTPIFEIAKAFERSRNAIELRIEKIKTEGITETKVKTNSKQASLDLYLEKKTIEEIATLRGMAVSTIEGHLALYIVSGEVNLFDFISEEQFQTIKAGVDKVGIENLSELKRFVGDSIPWGRLRMAVNYLIKNKYNL